MPKKRLTARQVLTRIARVLWQGRDVVLFYTPNDGWYAALYDGKPRRYLGRDQHAAAKFMCKLYVNNGGSF